MVLFLEIDEKKYLQNIHLRACAGGVLVLGAVLRGGAGRTRGGENIAHHEVHGVQARDCG